jgi:hypothetical protein
MKEKLFLLIIIMNLAFSPAVYAVENQFQINLGVTGAPDATAPSQPQDLVATAVSTSQINLTWSASTDNISVLAYRVYKDGIFIATSSVTSYSSTGLSADTLYTYNVSAVDTSYNESAQSSPASAQTLAGATPSTGGGGGGGGGLTVFTIYDLLVVPSERSVKITWKTYSPTISTFSWGTTGEYKDEVIRESNYTTLHEVILLELQPGTQYYFKIDSLTEGGANTSLMNQSFMTKGLPEGIPNATNFKAIADKTSIGLSWNNPSDVNFEEVRIVRSTEFYPADYLDGIVIFVDQNVQVGKTYFYSLFVKDKNGNYSSGVVSSAKVGKILGPDEEVPDVYDNLPKAPFVHPAIEALNFWDYDFIQDGKKINTPYLSQVSIDGEKNLTISIGYDKIPEVLKSIIVTLKDPEDPKKVFSFILKVNKEKTLYTATIAPLGRSGTYATRIAIVDYKNRGLKAIDGSMSVQLALTQSAGSDSSNRAFWIILVLLLLAYLARRVEVLLKNRRVEKFTNA